MTQYAVGDAVSHGGSSWRASIAHSDYPPGDPLPAWIGPSYQWRIARDRDVGSSDLIIDLDSTAYSADPGWVMPSHARISVGGIGYEIATSAASRFNGVNVRFVLVRTTTAEALVKDDPVTIAIADPWELIAAKGDKGDSVPQIIPIASETAAGVVERATDAEAAAGTDIERFTNSRQLKQRIDAAPYSPNTHDHDARYSQINHLHDGRYLQSYTPPIADTTTLGIVEKATRAEADDGTDTSRYMTPMLVQRRIDAAAPPTVSDATTTAKGVVERATASEADTGTDSERYMTPELVKRRIDATAPGAVVDASTTQKGIVERASASEADTGTDGTRYMSPALVKRRVDAGLAGKSDTSHNHDGRYLQSYTPPVASETQAGVVERANTTEADTGTDGVRYMTAALVKRRVDAGVSGISSPPNASLTARGLIELATQQEVDDGTDNERAVTPSGLQKSPSAIRNAYRGEWTLTNPYLSGMTVTLDGSWFICILANTASNSNKPDPTQTYHMYWRVVAGRGDDGTGGGTSTVPDASTTVKGIVERATDSEATTGTDTTRYVTPAQLKSATASSGTGTGTGTVANASESARGIIEIATQDEVDAGTDTERAVTPSSLQKSPSAIRNAYKGEWTAGNSYLTGQTVTLDGSWFICILANTASNSNKPDPTQTYHMYWRVVAGRGDDGTGGGTSTVPDASTTVKGIVERATDSEATTGTDTTRYVTPAQLKSATASSGTGTGTGTVANASESARGIIEIATQDEVDAGTDTERAVTPSSLQKSPSAIRNAYKGEWTAGNSYLTGQTVTLDGSWFINITAGVATNSNKPDPTQTYHGTWRVISRKGDKGDAGTGTGTGSVQDASTTAKGIVERATDSEASAGTDSTRYVTPRHIKAAIDAINTSGGTGSGNIDLNFKGQWTSGNTYSRFDTVSDAGSSFVAIVDNTASSSNRPDASQQYHATWRILAKKGDTGQAGTGGGGTTGLTRTRDGIARVPSKNFWIGDASWRGATSDGTTIWVIDDASKYARAWTASSQSRNSGRDISLGSSTGFGAARWAGAACDGTTIWFVEQNYGVAHAWNASSRNRDSGRDISLGSSSTGATQWWDGASDGSILWFFESNTNYARAWSASGRNRQSGRDIYLGTGTWRGMSSDGTTIWFVERGVREARARSASSGSRIGSRDIRLGPGAWWSCVTDGNELWCLDQGGERMHAWDVSTTAAIGSFAETHDLEDDSVPSESTRPISLRSARLVFPRATGFSVDAEKAQGGNAIGAMIIRNNGENDLQFKIYTG